jgi:2Fe-2S ferredoxin
MPTVTFVERDGRHTTIDAPAGLSLLDVAHAHGIDLEGACEGSMACSTCHVIVDPAWYGRLPAPRGEEEDVLDLVFHLAPTSRLGCQVRVTDDLEGLIVTVPAAHRNLLLE